MSIPVRLVYSLAPDDDAFREQLSAHLQPFIQKGLLTEWHEQLIPAGSSPTQERQRAWQSADILLLLLSADYFASDAFNLQTIVQALDRHRSGQIQVVPLLLRSCDWQSTPLAEVQCLPRNGKPVTLWENRDDALFSIVQELRRLITRQQPTTSPAPALTSEQRTNRQRLLKRVRTIHPDGMLKQSLQHAVWVDLHLQRQLDAVDNPWRLMVQELDREPRPPRCAIWRRNGPLLKEDMALLKWAISLLETIIMKRFRQFVPFARCCSGFSGPTTQITAWMIFRVRLADMFTASFNFLLHHH